MDKNWIDIIEAQAQTSGDKELYTLLEKGDVEGPRRSLSFSEVSTRSRAIGAQLASMGARGERVLISYADSLDFITAFFGAMFAGATAVPVRAPRSSGDAEADLRIQRVTEEVGARFALAPTQSHQVLPPSLTCLSVDEVSNNAASNWQHPGSKSTDLAFIQFTSGSTREPRGVCVSHENLIANSHAQRAAGFYRPHETHVSWLPHHHDMGLVGSLLTPAAGGVRSILMPPTAFIRKPIRWLEAISHFGATSSGGPSFAFQIAVDRITEEEKEGLNLRSWAMAYCGAEPIREESLLAFARAFESSGFQRSSFFPCYGMAESTLFVTGRKGLTRLSAADKKKSTDFSLGSPVSVGKPFDSTEVKIRSVEDTTLREDGEVGEIWITGPAVSDGYLDRATCRPRPWKEQLPPGSPAGYPTGDLGFIQNEELFICGRKKDIIIVRGQNIYPQDLEAIAERVTNTGMPNSAIAFAANTEGGTADEQIIILVAIPKAVQAADALRSLASSVKSAVSEAMDVTPHYVGIVNDRDLPKTSSGKVQRSECKRRWIGDEIQVRADSRRVLNPEISVLYPLLDETTAPLEKRKLGYRFDLEADVAWHRIVEPGRYFPDEYLVSIGADPEALRSEPGALEFFELSCAYLNSRTFVTTESMIGDWLTDVRGAGALSRSLDLLEEEEVKHVKLFRRYSDALREMRPDQMAKIENLFTITTDFLDREFISSARFESELNRHYEIWLAILYLEEHTTWIHQVLRPLGADLQPCWLDAHYVHRREETQHVLTDDAYLRALDAPPEHLYRWSANLFGLLFSAFRKEQEAILDLTEQEFPNLKGRVRAVPSERRRAARAGYTHSLFRRTRRAAPFLAHFARPIADGQNFRQEKSASIHELENWLFKTVGKLANVGSGRIMSSDNFTDLGLDSVGHLTISSGLEQRLGIELSGELTYQYPTIESLLGEIAIRIEGAGTDKNRSPDESGTSGQTQATSSHRDKELAGKITLNAGTPLTPVFWLGGSPNTLDFMLHNFPRNRAFHLLQHQGYDGAVPRQRSIREISAFYADTIEYYARGSAYIGGYSLGASISLHIAQELLSRGFDVKRLLLLSPAGLDQRIETPGKHPLEWARRSIRRSQSSLNQKLRASRARAKLAFGMPLSADQVWSQIRPIYGKALTSYGEPSYDGPSTFIHEENVPAEKWRARLGSQFTEIGPLPCKHLELFDEPHAFRWLGDVLDSLD